MKNLPEHSEWSWEQIREFLSTLINFRTVSSNLLYLKQNIINQTSFLDEFYQTQVHIKVRIEAILRNIRSQNDIPLCSICNQNPVKLVKEPAKFSEVCSKDCSHALSHKKSKKTFMKKHGVEHPYQVPEIKEKLKTVFQERYGVNSPLALEEVQQKSKQTIRERYGVEHQCQSDEIMNKIKQTNLSNYGVEYTYQREEFKRKSKEVNRDRHGVDYYVQSNEFKTKYKQASIGRYGAEHHMQRNFSEETKQILSNREKLKELYDLHGGIKLSKQLGVWDCVVYDRLRKFDIPLNDSKVSAAERQVASFIKSLGFDIITNSRDILNGKELDIYIPDKGISTATYYKRLWRILDQEYDVILIILDEIDKLENDAILMQLSRAGEAGKLTECKIGVIGISNKIKYKDRMDERVKSSLCEREFVFPPYNAGQLNSIMEARSDAFRKGVLEEAVIPKAAALAAREHGDARKAIDILRYAGEIAQAEGSETVCEEFVVQAREQAEIDRFRELIRGSTPHSRYVLQALTVLSLDHGPNGSSDLEEGFRTTRIYDVYEQICRQEGVDSLSLRRVRDLLKEHAFLDVIEQSRHSGGSAEGSYTEHMLLEDPAVVKNVLAETVE